MARLIVADASALIAYLDARDAHHAGAVRALAEVDGFVIHPVTLAEVLVHPTRVGNAVEVVGVLTAVGMQESLMHVNALDLARVRVETRLNLPDALVLATASWHHLAVLTFDEDLRSAVERRAPHA